MAKMHLFRQWPTARIQEEPLLLFVRIDDQFEVSSRSKRSMAQLSPWMNESVRGEDSSSNEMMDGLLDD
jgi:hypothetical protein